MSVKTRTSKVAGGSSSCSPRCATGYWLKGSNGLLVGMLAGTIVFGLIGLGLHGIQRTYEFE